MFKDPIVTVARLIFYHAQSNSKKWPNKIKLHQMKFFLETQLIKSSCTYQPLSFCKILKILLEPIQSYGDVSFLSKKWNICSKQNIFGTQNYYQFHLPIGPFQCAKVLKNSYSRSRIMRMCHFWAQNGPFLPIFFFFFFKMINIIFIYLLAPFNV